MRVLAVLWTLCLARFCSARFYTGRLNSGGNTPIYLITPFILDLAVPNEDLVDVSARDMGEVVYRRYSPREGGRIDAIVDSDMAVWSTGADEECAFVKSYGDGQHTLLTICVHDGINGYSFRYFVKNEKWVPVSKKEFAASLGEMLDKCSSYEIPKELLGY
ncbi:signal peptide containing protein [Theileria equi strain WA]|uniref:Signal peptide containing protein n=1 Tax=Theileria equi strain WA TaxID=1537102 RepID=L1LAC0_THEEQ|nr:signal peptide containing protein [Theileria equi strain WA]EKX72417.1 signal peptide containing protein [Theileria equi strain WA]|eukprot:XP_004831869.1 signal peptide containing protein [Theileria equi strain WA]